MGFKAPEFGRAVRDLGLRVSGRRVYLEDHMGLSKQGYKYLTWGYKYL